METDRNRIGRVGVVVSGVGIAAAGVLMAWASLGGSRLREQADDLENERLASVTRLELNSQILEDLLDGRCSLTDAVDLRMQVNKDVSKLWAQLRSWYPMADDRERMAWSLVVQVEIFVQNHPGLGSQAADRVHKEFAAMIGSHSWRDGKSEPGVRHFICW